MKIKISRILGIFLVTYLVCLGYQKLGIRFFENTPQKIHADIFLENNKKIFEFIKNSLQRFVTSSKSI